MPFCVKCGNRQGRLNAGGLCKTCKNKKIKNNNSINNDITVSSDGMNNYYNNYVQSINRLSNVNLDGSNVETSDVNNTNVVSTQESATVMLTEFLIKPITELCVKDMLMICVDVNKPLASKLDAIQKEMSNKVTLLEQKVKLLETENNVKEDKIETLTSIVVSKRT